MSFLVLLVVDVAKSQTPINDFKTIHVKFKDQFKPRTAISGRSNRSGITPLDIVSEKNQAVTISRLFPDAGIYEAAHEAYGLHLWYEIKFSKSVGLQSAISDYRKLEYFQTVEECKEYTASWDTESPTPELPTGSNDPYFSSQWHYNNTGQTGGTAGADINLLKAWQTETGSPNVIVAVIDAGIDLNHPDLRDALWTNPDEIPANGIDDDHNGFVDDVHGYGFGDQSPIIYPHNHGTHVAGTIGALSNNGIGVSGIAGGSGSADGVRLMSCAGFGAFATGHFEQAMVYAADNGAVISQNSWGGGSSAIQAAINYFIERAGYDNTAANFNQKIQTGPMAGGIVFFAAGNSNSADPWMGYPGSLPNVIAVASTNSHDQKSSFSNYGEWVDIAAPGSDVLSTTISSGYGYYSGTSMACPHVSGVAALVISHLQRPGLRHQEIWNSLRFGARDIDSKNPEFAGQLGEGRLDAYRSLHDPDAIPPAAITDLAATAIHFSSVTLQWTASGASGNVGRAAAYDIRYSASPINASNFDQAQQAASPEPSDAGQQDVITVINLVSTQVYYFAIKSIDLFDNVSPISNVVTVTTKAPPKPELVTTSLSEQLFTGAISTKDVQVKNVGGDDLLVRLGVADIEPAPVGIPTGSKGRLFAINTMSNTIEELNTQSGIVMRSIPLPEPSTKLNEGLAFDGTSLFYGRYNKIHKIDAQTGNVLWTVTIGYPTIRGLAWSGRYLYVSTASSSLTFIAEVDPNHGNVVRQININGGELTFAGSRGTLFQPGYGGTIEEININTEQVVNSITIFGNPRSVGYSHRANLLFVSDGYSGVVKAIHPSTGVVSHTFPYPTTTALAGDESTPRWLTSNEQVVSIPPGESLGIPASFIATGLSSGQWSGTLSVVSVNINEPDLSVGASLTVATATDIEVIKNLDFGDQFLGTTIDSTLSIENRGFSNLVVSSIQSSDPRVTASLPSVTLSPGQSTPLIVTVTSPSLGAIDATITISSNDPDEGIIPMGVHVAFLASPAIDVDPEDLSATLATDESTTLSFDVTNSGESILHWTANLAGSSGAGLSSMGEPESLAIPALAIVDEVILRAPSPEPVVALSFDSQSGLMFAHAVSNYNFYKYNPVANTWTKIGLAPILNYGQPTVLAGKIFNGGDKLNVYNIQGNSWSQIPFPIAEETGTLVSDGQYIYLPFGKRFFRYDPFTSAWLELATSPRFIGPNGALSASGGTIFAHELGLGGFTGNGGTGFLKYHIASNTWIQSDGIPGKVSNSSAIDPAGRKYFVVGSPQNLPEASNQMAILNIPEGEWKTIVTPFTVSYTSALAFVGSPGVSGIYFNQYDGTGFARYVTAPANDWVTISPKEGNLAPTESQAVQVNLSAVGLEAGTYSGDLRVSSSHPPLEKNVALTLTVTGSPNIQLDKTNVNVSEVAIGKQRGVYLSIKNNGTAMLNIASITTDHPDFYVDISTPLNLMVGEYVLLAPQFVPTATGQVTGTFTIHNNDPDAGDIQFSMTGTGVYPPIPGITPGSLSVSLLSGATSVHTFTVSNSGGAMMDVAVDFDPNWAWLEGRYFGDLGAGETKDINVTVNAGGKSAGTYTGKILLWHHGDIYQELPVTMTVTDATDILTSKKSIDFGDQFVNNMYDSSILIKNNGVLPLSITSISSDNPAFTITEPGPLDLLPGESVEASIRFHPTSVSSQTGVITFTSNDPDEATYVIELAGSGVNPPVVGSNMSSLSSVLFSGESQTQSMTLQNSGGSLLRWKMSGQFSSQPLSVVGGGDPSQIAGQGDFTTKAPAPERLISMAASPTGLIYGQAPWSQYLWAYNPQTNAWSNVGHVISATTINEHGGSVFLNSKLYCVYSEDALKMYVYSFALKNWTILPQPLGAGTSTITTDGSVIFVAGGGKFMSYNPAMETWIELPIPNINLDGKGGLAYHDGAIYAHEGTGNGFAKYSIVTQSWETLVPLPDNSALGGTIDPVRKRYYTYGKNAGSYIYEYDITSNQWNVINFNLFDLTHGGIVYEPNAGVSGIYLLQGDNPNGLARYEPRNELTWLRASPITGEIEGSGNQSIGINFSTFGLAEGTYSGSIEVTSNDPEEPMMAVPVTLEVIDPSPTIIPPSSISTMVDRVQSYVAQLRIENTGYNTLQWSIPNLPSERITLSANSGSIAGHSFDDITLTFDPTLMTELVLSYSLEIVSNDPHDPMVTTNLTFTIPNAAPFLSAEIGQQEAREADIQIPLMNHFSDPDGDPLTFTAHSTNTNLATATLNNSILTIKPLRSGNPVISVTATDSYQSMVTTTFIVAVEIVTGLESDFIETKVTASPNPFATEVAVRYQARNAGQASVSVIDISGKVAWESGTYQEVTGINEVRIEGRNFSPGLYNCILMRDGAMVGTVRLLRN